MMTEAAVKQAVEILKNNSQEFPRAQVPVAELCLAILNGENTEKHDGVLVYARTVADEVFDWGFKKRLEERPGV